MSSNLSFPIFWSSLSDLHFSQICGIKKAYFDGGGGSRYYGLRPCAEGQGLKELQTLISHPNLKMDKL